MNHRVTVDLGERSYDVRIGAGVRAELPSELSVLGGPTQVAVVTSPHLRELYGDDVAARLRDAGHGAWVAEMLDGEEHKTLDTAAGLYDQFIERRMERSSLVVALGGGVVGDVRSEAKRGLA